MTANTPLAGLKIVSMAEQYPGPLATMILSDMGADVIQVERPGIGDPSRFLTGFFEAMNRGKRSVALDIRKADDKAELLALIAQADVFMEGFRPGKLAKQGLGYDDISPQFPQLIYCSITGYGQTGPYRNRPGHDLTLQGIGGALEERLTGDVRGLPPALLLGDNASGLFAVIGILAALQARDRNGQGTFVDISMSDSVTALFSAAIGMEGQAGDPPPQAEPAYDVFTCADGAWITLSIAHEDAYWDRLCTDLGLDDLIGMKRPARVAARAALRGRIAAVIITRNRDEWEAVMEAAGQMWGPVNRLADLPQDPHIQHRELLAQLTRADGVNQYVVRQPVKFSAYGNAPLRRAPALDEHRGAQFDAKIRLTTA
ncbi:CaiB/BaiF CoA transferase family protein [Pararhodobacter oceanensis]|uniref:CoA transferase n=1 Tax=Pararhodobacter oceanensis TaxID=2172121 RepID=A0A2T8HXT3_9RHOB|nr:CaiB/BaiF CoA-transferase family protein [Pararhodobacter oceanensis]PVH30240.1 CoA transferase [Pararhodobacter oceanensis]